MTYENHIHENDSFAVSDFLKKNYDKIFIDPNQSLNNLFVDFTKRIDRDKNSALLYQKFIKSNQTLLQNEINNAESIEEINKIVSNEIKYFYFSLKPIVNKLQNDEFTMEEIFSKSRDKNLKALMSYDEEKFANAAPNYVDMVLEDIKEDSGINKKTPEETPEETQKNDEVTERIKYNIIRILEAEDLTPAEDLNNYKQSAIKWLNYSLFEALKPKYQLLTKIGNSTSNIVDQLSDQMESTSNDNAKKMILNKIINMDKDELKNLALSLGISEKELGEL